MCRASSSQDAAHDQGNLGVLSDQLRAETELTVEDFSSWNTVSSQSSFANRGLYVDSSTAWVNGLLLLSLVFISLQRITGFDVYVREGVRRWREESKKKDLELQEDERKTDGD